MHVPLKLDEIEKDLERGDKIISVLQSAISSVATQLSQTRKDRVEEELEGMVTSIHARVQLEQAWIAVWPSCAASDQKQRCSGVRRPRARLLEPSNT